MSDTPSIDKKSLSERDICTKFLTPALAASGWDIQTQILEQFTICAGQIQVRGSKAKRGERRFADYALFYKPGLKIGVLEAKDNKHSLGAGMPQALDYADRMNVPFAFSSNGDAFLFHDKTVTDGPVESQLALDQFPSPEELWEKYCNWKHLTNEPRRLVEQDYHSDGSGKNPRYYQLNAINNSIEAVANGDDRILLVMATGTGKTYTAFQIIWRLWKSGAKKRILFLADRNVLVDQTKTNDFKPFGAKMTKITGRKIDPAYEIHLALYQAITGPEEQQKAFKQVSPEFFDLIIVDECHRGSAAEDSAWREILEYFSGATQIGLTATPKETAYISNASYFGKPVYEYSLKQGISDGYLAPYKVVRIDFDKDLQGWRPTPGKTDALGNVIEDRIYNQQDIDRALVLDQRTQLVANKVSELLRKTNRYDKTIVFCEDIDHAERMRQAIVNENPDLALENHRYVTRITGDNSEGKAELDNFIDPESRYPVIATTSKLMSTGVDAKTCKIIVLDRRIGSMTEFKQIIGRGTRIDEDYGKLFFTIIDFKKATELFADPDFDGEPTEVYEPGEDGPIVPDDADEQDQGEGADSEADDFDGDDQSTGPRAKYYVNDVEVSIVAERVQYYGNDGRLITESLRDYTKKTVKTQFESLDLFLQHWTQAEQKQVILNEMEEQGVFFEALADEVGKEYGAFDLICHVAFDQPPLTRKERAENVRKRDYFTKYGDQARAVLDALLNKFAEEGVVGIEDLSMLRVNPFDAFGTPVEIVRLFGGKKQFQQAIRELEAALFGEAG